jgi:tryptophanyl-tRNA synthetase
VFHLLSHFASPEKTDEVRARLEAGGMGWGDLKNELFVVLKERLGPLRERYEALMQPGSELEELLAIGAAKARKRAQPVLEQVRKAIGIG